MLFSENIIGTPTEKKTLKASAWNNKQGSSDPCFILT